MEKRLKDEPDFICLKRHGYSLKKLSDRYPDGCPDHVIANALLLKEEDIEPLYKVIIKKLQTVLGIDNS